MPNKTELYQLTETSPFMMGFVFITKENHAVVIDGGRTEDVPLLLKHIGGRRVSAWFLTHPHDDHIDAFIDIIKNHRDEVEIDAVYYHFPPAAFISKHEHYEVHTISEFCGIEPMIADIRHVVRMGDVIEVDEVRFEILFQFNPIFQSNAVNDSSIVIKATTPNKTVLFLGDLGPEAGDELLRLQGDNLKADLVQMAHHGHMCISSDVYMMVNPEACLWCAPGWLYEEKPDFIRERMYGTKMTRMWMDRMGVKTHYVTKDGTQRIEL